MIVAEVAAVVVGVALVLYTLGSAVKTVVVPRAYQSGLTRIHFVVWRRIFDVVAKPGRSFAERDAVLALYAPIGLVTLPAQWVTLVVIGFCAVDWGTGVQPLTEALVTSGSSLLTLGFVRPPGTWRVLIAFAEAGIGLVLVSLMISYLPTIYGAFSRREALVGMLEVRAGLPPSPAELLVRYQRVRLLDQLDEDLFRPWESWFVDVEESHTSHPALVHFRSPHPERSWITAAGCVLDTAALAASVLDRPYNARGPLMMRTGFFCLRRVSDYFGLPYDPDPAPDAPISVTRREFDNLCVELQAAGVPLKADRDKAWADFAGWRVNYDAVLLQLCAMVMAPPARWSSDRMPPRPKPKLRPTRRSRVAGTAIR
ncbi:MAG: hypothetical protein U0Q03_13970 [Acidimicrobiales bacterium]